MQTTAIGNHAEQAAAEYLERLGFVIVDRNWRRRDCEIDIVARKASTIYFVEVKYRFADGSGSGIEYITPQKVKRMAYAASRWVQENHWRGEQMLSGLEVSGQDYEVTAFVEEIY